jgi:hypothetical protein
MLFERVIAARLEAHISGRVPGWHESQYGFRRGRSTVDTVKRVRSMAEDMVSRYGTAAAVSLDVINAFNFIPWARIMETLRHFEVPAYLVEIIGAYLNQPSQSYPGAETAKDDRYPNSQRISNNILRVGDSAGGVSPV